MNISDGRIVAWMEGGDGVHKAIIANAMLVSADKSSGAWWA